jgi:hypothetical protein
VLKGHEEICIHYDSSRLSFGEVRDLAGRVGAKLDKRLSAPPASAQQESDLPVRR